MKNKDMRKFMDTVAELVNDSLQKGVAPIFISSVLTNFSAQCDNLARQLEEKEEAYEKEQEHDKENEPVNG